MKTRFLLNYFRRAILLFCLYSAQLSWAGDAVYTLMLEWPVDSDYSIAVTGQTQSGITQTPVLQFHGQNRQSVFIVPAISTCQTDKLLSLNITAAKPLTPAKLTIWREHTLIYQQMVASALTSNLPALDASLCQQAKADIVGELSIVVAKAKSGATFNLINLVNFDIGHAWVEFRALSSDLPVAYATAGTYNSAVGDNVVTGINFFREADRPASARKTVALNRSQYQNFIALINQYVAAGTQTWTPWHNCTAFAIEAWAAATGEQLSASLVYPNAPWEVAQLGLPNSISLYYAILAAGGEDVP